MFTPRGDDIKTEPVTNLRIDRMRLLASGPVDRGSTRMVVGNTDLRMTDMFKLEVIGPDGLLLGEIPLTHFVDMIHVHRDRLFLLDRDRGVKFCEYKISDRPGSY